MNIKQYNTLAVSNSLEGIKKLIDSYFYSDIKIEENTNILTGNGSKFFSLYNRKGEIKNYLIIQQGNFKFLCKK